MISQEVVIARKEKLLNGYYFWTVNQPMDGFYGRVLGHYDSRTVAEGKREVKKDFPSVIFK